jgi:hypothetical protein
MHYIALISENEVVGIGVASDVETATANAIADHRCWFPADKQFSVVKTTNDIIKAVRRGIVDVSALGLSN